MTDTPIADMMAEMLSGGIPPDKILLAIRAVEQIASNSRLTDQTATRRRVWDRERKRQLRLQRPPDSKSGDSLSSTPMDSEVKKEKKKERKSGNICPPDFHPTEEHYLLGQTLNYTRSRVDSMRDDMKSWSVANANRAIARKADWGLTFTGWLKRSAKQNGGLNGKRSNSLSSVADELIARSEERERTIDLGPADYLDAGFEVGEGHRR